MFYYLTPINKLDNKYILFLNEFLTFFDPIFTLKNKNKTKEEKILIIHTIILSIINTYKNSNLKNSNLNNNLSFIFYNFDYSVEPVHYTNDKFWKVSKLQIEDKCYYYHKETNLIFINYQCEFIWIGIFDKNISHIIYRSQCDKNIEKWVTKCGFI